VFVFVVAQAEASMISRLKQQSGTEYTAKMQRMFTDISLSEAVHTQFLASPHAQTLPTQMHALVLQLGAWPLGSSQTGEFTAPPEAVECMRAFLAFYNSCHTGRKLTWLHHLGTVGEPLCGFF
jgi:hypothetical protein